MADLLYCGLFKNYPFLLKRKHVLISTLLVHFCNQCFNFICSIVENFRQLLLRTTQPFIAVLKSTPFFSIAIQRCTYFNGIHGTHCVKETRIHVPPLISSTVTVHPPLSTPPFTPSSPSLIQKTLSFIDNISRQFWKLERTVVTVYLMCFWKQYEKM